jgi:ABC-2 type transport system permease protein
MMRAAGILLRFQVRRDRWILSIWMAGVVALLGVTGLAVAREFGDDRERSALVAVATGNPAFLFIRGLPDGSGVGAVTYLQIFAFLSVLIALMNVVLIVRHTRADEERGRSELLLATPVARAAELASALVVALLADLAVSAGSAIVCLIVGFGGPASLVTGAAIGSVGIAFAGLTAVCTQIMPSPRGANGLGAGLVGVAYLVRGVGDALGTATDAAHVAPSWISRLSPIGWAQASAPFSAANPVPLLVPLALGVAAALVALAIRARRDLGASLVAEAEGRAVWPRATTLGLVIRQQGSSVIGWAIGSAVLGSFAGFLAPLVTEAVESNDALAHLVGQLVPGLDTDTATLFIIALLGVSGLLATAAGVQTVMRPRSDEAEGRAEAILSSQLTRAWWLGLYCMAAAVAVLGVALVAALSAGISLSIAHGDIARLGTTLAMVLVELPAGSVFLGLTALVFATLPRLTVALGWGLFVIGLILGQLGDLLALPQWLRSISPFSHVPVVPFEEVDPLTIIILLTITAALMIGAVLALQRRDIPE